MTNQSVSIFETDGGTWWAQNASTVGLAKMASLEPLVKITKINSTEIDLQYQTDTIVLNGTFNLSSLSTTPQTLLDLLNTPTNFQSTSFISNELSIDTSTNPSQVERVNFTNAISLQDGLPLFLNTNQTVYNNTLSGNDIYIMGQSGAANGNTANAYLYGGNNVFVDGDKYVSSTTQPDYFHGGSGINTVILPGNSSNYKITTSSTIYNDMTGLSNLSGFIITDNTKNINTLDVSSITYAQFADKMINMSDMSTVTVPVTTTKSAVYMGSSDAVTVADSGTKVYGGKGTETVTISFYSNTVSAPFSNYIHNVTIDQNVGQIDLSLPSFLYEFQQAGNTINIYDSTGANLILSGPVQGGSTGTLFTFADGTASVVLNAGKMTLGGALLSSSQPSAVAPTLTTNVISTATSTTSQVYMAANDFFHAATSGETIFGNSGYEIVKIVGADATGNNGVHNITLDQNVDELDFGQDLNYWLFQQTGNTINVYTNANALKASIPVQSAGTTFFFSDGTTTAKLSNGIMTLGGVAVSSVTPTAVSIPGFATTVNVDGTQTTLDGSGGKTSFVVAPGTFNVTISGFKATDHISFANNSLVSVSNTSYTDGSVTLQYSSGGQTEKVILIGLSGVQDAAINSATDLNTVFGTGTLV